MTGHGIDQAGSKIRSTGIAEPGSGQLALLEPFGPGKPGHLPLNLAARDAGDLAPEPAEASGASPLPSAAKPVSLRRKPHTTEGMVEENFDWLTYLTDGKGKHGRDPMTIPVEVLTGSGHPPRRTRDLVAAFNKATGGENFGLEPVKRHRDIRAWCLACTAGNDAETRHCSTFHCPFWPYRMGRNPHNPKRGTNPFADGSMETAT